MKQSDLAQKKYWDGVYGSLAGTGDAAWKPRGYEERVIGHELDEALCRRRPETVLEIGCGDSPWLPYLAMEYQLEVAGVDYSEKGCELARSRLERASVQGAIHCRDLFSLAPEEIGTFDLVYSLGVVEHFSDLQNILGQLLNFVRPGGMLFTSVPNLRSIHGLSMWLYQPELLRKHRMVTREELANVYQALGLHDIRTHHAGLASAGIVSRGVSPRIPCIDGAAVLLARGINSIFQLTMKRVPVSRGLPWLAPFIVAAGCKGVPENPR